MISVSPIRTWVEKRGAPRWLAATIAILSVYLILVLMALALVVSAAKLAQLVPDYSARLTDLAESVGQQLANLGVSSAQIDSMVSSLDFGRVFSIATNILSGSFSVLTNIFLIATLAVFLAMDAGNFPRHLQEAREARPAVVDAIESFIVGTRRYFAVSTVFGLIVAVIDTIALAIMGVPAAIVWGVLAFVTNFIPNIGFVIGLVPPALLALLDGGWTEMIAVIIVYSVINVGIQSGIQPKIVGDALGLSYDADVRLAAVLGLGARPARCAAGDPAHAAGQGDVHRRRPQCPLGHPADVREGSAPPGGGSLTLAAARAPRCARCEGTCRTAALGQGRDWAWLQITCQRGRVAARVEHRAHIGLLDPPGEVLADAAPGRVHDDQVRAVFRPRANRVASSARNSSARVRTPTPSGGPPPPPRHSSRCPRRRACRRRHGGRSRRHRSRGPKGSRSHRLGPGAPLAIERRRDLGVGLEEALRPKVQVQAVDPHPQRRLLGEHDLLLTFEDRLVLGLKVDRYHA